VIGFEVKVDPNQFGPELLRRWAFSVNNALAKAAANARGRCRRIYRKALQNSREYRALFMEVPSPNSVGLQGELGLADPETDVNNIIDATVGALKIEIIKAKASWAGLGSIQDFGGLRVVVVPKDLSFLLSLDSASYTSYRGEVEWLSWLLYSGTSVIISDYYVMYDGSGEPVAASRTDDALMVPRGKSKRNFKIRASFSGVDGNNWITRAGLKAEEEIKNALTEELRKALS
jgi:hypothetical protein